LFVTIKLNYLMYDGMNICCT